MDYREIVEQCGLSEEMKEHLVKERLSKQEVVQLIVNAPVALNTKKKLLEEIVETEDLYQEMSEKVANLFPGEDQLHEWETVWKYSAKRLVDEYQKAIEALQVNEGEFLWMEEHWFDYDWLDGNQGGGCAFQTLDAALHATRKIMQEEEWDENTECWMELTKWVPGEHGVMENCYRYYLIRDEIVYFSKIDTEQPRTRGYLDPYCFVFPTDEVFFLTPFQPGDIVTLDPRPFAPPINAVLLGTRHDCCGLRGLYCGIDGLWHDVAIYHKHGWDDISGYEPILSPIYRLSTCSLEDLLPDERVILQTVHNYIGGSEYRGDEVDSLFYHGAIGPEKVLKRLRQLEMEKQQR